MVSCRIVVTGHLEGDVSIVNIDLSDGKDCHENNMMLAQIMPEGCGEDGVLLQPAINGLMPGVGPVHCSTLLFCVGHPLVDIFEFNSRAVSVVSSVGNHHVTPAEHALELALEDAQVVHLSTWKGAIERDDVACLDADSELNWRPAVESITQPVAP